ncbi:helix-turn-helix transcriptional regulator [Microtetraspora sp. AC03309]|uniref:helix-turn-helix domain-containing protein n=1 Tax=Microtetraspora sp. AC03309 TaxID=2779376 RepID=UPI001E44EE38|nr:helix-turn-helix transcriptional regulator [Microtetraspora sp. AC03309]MCC5582027.1 helix-turn-helix transcriptional regulator [Microtetraspora sp. AC03309]
MATPSSSARQALEALGIRLREIRIDARLTGRDLAERAGWHSLKVSRIEYGKQAPTADDIRAWCAHCRAEDQSADLIASLRTAEGMFVEWRRMERTGLRLAQESVNPLWERTRHFRIYSSWLIPGPVQTRAYITALLTGIMRRRGLPDDVADAVQVRVDRQHVVHEGDHQFAIVLEEAVLRYPIGGTDTMAGQLGHLLTVATLPSISLGIIPLGADRSARWPSEGFFMYDDEVVNVELTSGHLTVTQPREVAMYADTFAMLASLAVYGSAARSLITAAIGALDS